jgi:hypothetical protein
MVLFLLVKVVSLLYYENVSAFVYVASADLLSFAHPVNPSPQKSSSFYE